MKQPDAEPLRSTDRWKRTAAAVAVVLVASAIVLRAMGRGWWCTCGEPDLFSWHVWSRHNSQHVIDPYTFSHVLHGLIFYWLAFLTLRARPFWIRLGASLVAEAAWEIAENTNRVIERYREVTISLDYFGDSVINSLADILACAGGFLLAASIPVWLSIMAFVTTEVVLLVWIRDCLLLNVVMLLYPIEAIKEWQMSGMLELAPDLFLLRGIPQYAFNVYVMGGVVVDSGTRWAWPRVRRQLTGLRLSAHALTHGHPDHQGSSRRVCETFDLPLLCGEGDAQAVEGGDWVSLLPRNPLTVLGGRLWVGPPCPVARRLHEDDEVGGFTVVETPGHSPGHVSFWRGSDGVLVVGDVVNNLNYWKGGVVELRMAPTFFTPDPTRNLASARKLAALRPRLVCFGHGPPRPGEEFVRFVGGQA